MQMKSALTKKRFVVPAVIFAAIAGLGIYAVLPVFEPMPDDTPLREGLSATPEGAGTLRLRALAEKSAEQNPPRLISLEDAAEQVMSGNFPPETYTPEEEDFIAYFKRQRERGVYADYVWFQPPDDPQDEESFGLIISEFPHALLNRNIPWDETAAEKISAFPENREALAVFEEETDFRENLLTHGKLTSEIESIPFYMRAFPLIQLKIRADLERGDAASALARFRRALAQLRSRESGLPTLISLLTSINLRERLFAETLQDFFLAGTPIAAETLAALKREIETERSREIDFIRVVKTEYAYALLIFKCMKTPPEDLNGFEKFYAEIERAPWFSPRALEKFYRKRYLRLLEQLEAGKTPSELEKKEAPPCTTFREIVSVEMPTIMLFGGIDDSLRSGLALAERRRVRTNTQACLTLAAHEYRLAHGAFPQTLAALVPEFLETRPRDPLSGASYEIDPETNVIFPAGAEFGGELDDIDGSPKNSDAVRLHAPNARDVNKAALAK